MIFLLAGCNGLRKPDGTVINKKDPAVTKMADGSHVYTEADGTQTPLERIAPDDQATSLLTAILPLAATNPYTQSTVMALLIALGAYKKVKPQLVALKEIYKTVEEDLKGPEKEQVLAKLSSRLTTKSKGVITKMRSKDAVEKAKAA